MTNTNLYQALIKCQADMPPVVEQSTNPAFRSRYADLESVIGTVGPVLRQYGILFTQSPNVLDGQRVLSTVIIHAETGEFIISNTPIVAKDPDDPQKMGGAITYARRYGLLSMLGIATTDDDGQQASQPRQPSTPSQPDLQKALVREPESGYQVRWDTSPVPNGDVPSAAQLKFIRSIAREKNIDDDHLKGMSLQQYGTDIMSISKRDASAFIDILRDTPAFSNEAAAPSPQPANPAVHPMSAANQGMDRGAVVFWSKKIQEAGSVRMLDDIVSELDSRFGNANVDDAIVDALRDTYEELEGRA